jgi:hypothetical protein
VEFSKTPFEENGLLLNPNLFCDLLVRQRAFAVQIGADV